MDSVNLTTEQISHVRPLPGRVLLEIEAKPEMIGSIVAPEIARDKKALEDPLQIGRVLAIGYGGHHEYVERKLKRFDGFTTEDVQPGDRVLFRALASELNQRFVLTDARRVDAVVT